MDALEAVTPIDGRYRKQVEPLAEVFSEKALIRYRVTVEGEYLIALTEETNLKTGALTDAEKQQVRALYSLSTQDAQLVKDIEFKGHGAIKATNHDVKAVEYFLKKNFKNRP